MRISYAAHPRVLHVLTHPFPTRRAADLKRVATDILMYEGIPETVKKSISQQMARYGLIGKAEKMNEVGITKVTLDDGSTVSFRGEPEPLTVANAEAFHKAINDLYKIGRAHV